MSVLTVAGLTLRELQRRRVFIVMVVITLVTVALSGWGLHALYNASFGPHASFSPGEARFGASEELVLFLFMFGGVVALTAVAAGAPAVAGDLEAGVLPALLARPLARWELIVGKWVGLAAVLVVYIAVTSALELRVALSIVGYAAPHPGIAVLSLCVEGLAIMSLTLLLSTRLSAMAAGVVAAAAYFVAWAAGVSGGVGQLVHSPHLVEAATVMKLVVPTDGMWRTAVFNLEPALALQGAQARLVGAGLAADPFFVSQAQPTAFYIWVGVWIAGVVALAVWSFARREV